MQPSHSNTHLEIVSQPNDQFEIPEMIQRPLNKLILLAIDRKLSSRSIDFEKNQVRFIRYNHSWILIFRDSYFAVPEKLMHSLSTRKSPHNPFIEYLKSEGEKYKLRYRDEKVLVYSVNIPLTEIVVRWNNAELLRILGLRN